MKMILLRLLPVLFATFCINCSNCKKDLTPTPGFTINVADDGVGDFFAEPVTNAIYDLTYSTGDPIPVAFVRGEVVAAFYFHDYDEWASRGSTVGPPHVFMGSDRVEIDGKEHSTNEFADFLKQYRSAADKTGSTVSLLVSVSPSVKFGVLMDYLELMTGLRYKHLILTKKTANKTR